MISLLTFSKSSIIFDLCKKIAEAEQGLALVAKLKVMPLKLKLCVLFVLSLSAIKLKLLQKQKIKAYLHFALIRF